MKLQTTTKHFRKDIMNILVIGNGFDLAHGLHTKYGDFIRFVQGFQMYKESPDSVNNDYYDYFSSLKERKKEIFNELDNLIYGNRWLKYFIGICDKRQLEGKEGWIDFEAEISFIIQKLDDARKTLNDRIRPGIVEARLNQTQLNVLCPILYPEQRPYRYNEIRFDKSFIGIQKECLLNELNALVRCLEIYLSDYVSSEKCKQFKDIVELRINKVLSFNYTETYKNTYGKTGVEYNYIHGKARIDSNKDVCNLVLGIDEYLPDNEMNQDNEFIQFKKFYQRIFKGTGCHYVDWLDSINSINRSTTGSLSQHNIYFYGHSLDVTDKDIIHKLIMAEKFKTTFFYHNKEALGKMIANLVKVIGEEELVRQTDGNNRKIVFQQTSTETV